MTVIRRIAIRIGPPAVALVLGLLLWELAVTLGWVSHLVLPSPVEVMQSLINDRSELAAAFLSTATAVIIGFTASTLSGLGIAIALSSSELGLRAFYPYAVFFQTVPIVAIAPLLVIWFGYGMTSVIASAFIVSLFPMIACTLTGLKSTDPALRDLFRLYRAGRAETLVKLVIPFALPHILSGLRIVAGLAVIGTVVGEFLGGVGLGSVVDVARTQQRLDKVFAAVFLASLLGLMTVALVDLISYLSLRRWHASHTEGD